MFTEVREGVRATAVVAVNVTAGVAAGVPVNVTAGVAADVIVKPLP